MATAVNLGTDFRVWNFSVPQTVDTQIVLNEEVNAVFIQCRTATDILLKRTAGSSDYFTIKAGTVLRLDSSTPNLSPFSLQSSSGTVNVEIIGIKV